MAGRPLSKVARGPKSHSVCLNSRVSVIFFARLSRQTRYFRVKLGMTNQELLSGGLTTLLSIFLGTNRDEDDPGQRSDVVAFIEK